VCPTDELIRAYMVEGFNGTAPSPLLKLLSVASAMASSLRLGSGAVALQRGPLSFFNSLLVDCPSC